jgi:hypothetical protein
MGGLAENLSCPINQKGALRFRESTRIPEKKVLVALGDPNQGDAR